MASIAASAASVYSSPTAENRIGYVHRVKKNISLSWRFEGEREIGVKL